MKLCEVFDKVARYEWDGDPSDDRGYAEATFTTNNKEYMVLFSIYENNKYSSPHTDIEFGLLPAKNDYSSMTKYNITGTGDQFVVMSTVKAIVLEWFKYHPTDVITMSADVPSRQKLYVRMLHNALPNWNIELDGKYIIAKR